MPNRKCSLMGFKGDSVMYGVLEYKKKKFLVKVCSKQHFNYIKNNFGDDPYKNNYSIFKSKNKFFLEHTPTGNLIDLILEMKDLAKTKGFKILDNKISELRNNRMSNKKNKSSKKKNKNKKKSSKNKK